ncbi:MAG TPA: flippase [Patescibacteria group bacterium]|nr:flippase [Patescibacteria group bacterium]
MSYGQEKIARNTGYFTLALIIQKIISFGYFSYIAVQIGAGSLGHYTFALFFTTIFAVIIDIGIANVLVREISRFKEKSQQYLSAALAIKIPLAILTYLAVAIVINLLDNPELVRQLVYLAGVVMMLDSFTLTFYAFLRGHQNLKFESIGTIVFQLILAISGIVIINLTKDLRLLILAIMAASLFNFIYSGILIKVKLGLKFFIKSNKAVIKSILIIAVPFALAAIFTRVYGYLDTVLLNQLIDETAVGYYSIPYKITFSLQFIPMAFVASLYPAFSSYFISSRELLKETLEKAMVYLGMIAVPLTLGVIALARPLILKVYTSEFEPSILPLQILMTSIFFLFLNFPLGSLLNACNRQSRNTVHIGLVMVLNIILNVILIPRYSYVGAAAASSVSTLAMFLLQLYVARQITPFSLKFLAGRFGKIIFSGAVMYLVIVYLLPSVNFLWLVPLGAVVYFVLLYLIKGFTGQDCRALSKSLFKRPA